MSATLERKATTRKVQIIEQGLKEGTVFKKGTGIFSKYTTKYFRLYNDEIAIFEDEFADEAIAYVDITARSVITPHDRLTAGKPGIEFLASPAVSAIFFYLGSAEERDEWVETLQYCISVVSDEHLWKNLSFKDELVEWNEGDEKDVKKRRKKRRKQKKEDRSLEEELVLIYKISNACLNGSDVYLCPPEKSHIYMPVFFEQPRMISDLYDYISQNPHSAAFAFMSKYAELSIHPVYNKSESFWEFEHADAYTRTYEFFKEEALHFPLSEGDVYEDLDLVDIVYGVESPIVKLEVKKVFASGHKPCLVEMTYADEEIPPSRVVFKDDDLRPDLMVENMFEVFNFLWRMSGLPIEPQLITFKVVPGGLGWGLMEFVQNSRSVRDFDFTILDTMDTEDQEVFLATAAGGFVGAFLLGIRDRHKDNLMIKDDNKFFQLDFKHAFNYKTFGIDSCRFAIPTDFKAKLKAWGKWRNFKNRCVAAHLVLRRNSSLILELCKHSFKGIFDLVVVEQELIHAFYLDRTEEEAAIYIKKLIESGVTSIKRVLKNATHELSGNIKDSKK